MKYELAQPYLSISRDTSKYNLEFIKFQLHQDKKCISVGFIGYPNVGKSSIINTLRAQKVCKVAPLAGETKVWQYITLMKRIYLIDCPGVVYPSGDTDTETVLKGVVRVENIKDPEDHIPTVLERVKKEYIIKTYKIEKWQDTDDFLEQMARRTGKLLKGAEPDIPTVAKMILNDWQRGKLPYFVKPPTQENEENVAPISGTEETTIVATEVEVTPDSTPLPRVLQDLQKLKAGLEFSEEDKREIEPIPDAFNSDSEEENESEDEENDKPNDKQEVDENNHNDKQEDNDRDSNDKQRELANSNEVIDNSTPNYQNPDQDSLLDSSLDTTLLNSSHSSLPLNSSILSKCNKVRTPKNVRFAEKLESIRLVPSKNDILNDETELQGKELETSIQNFVIDARIKSDKLLFQSFIPLNRLKDFAIPSKREMKRKRQSENYIPLNEIKKTKVEEVENEPATILENKDDDDDDDASTETDEEIPQLIEWVEEEPKIATVPSEDFKEV